MYTEPVSSDNLVDESNQLFPEIGKTAIAHTKTCLSGSSPEDGLTGGVGDTARLVPVIMGEDIGTGSGVYRGEAADEEGGKSSMRVPNAVLPVGGTAGP